MELVLKNGRTADEEQESTGISTFKLKQMHGAHSSPFKNGQLPWWGTLIPLHRMRKMPVWRNSTEFLCIVWFSLRSRQLIINRTELGEVVCSFSLQFCRFCFIRLFKVLSLVSTCCHYIEPWHCDTFNLQFIDSSIFFPLKKCTWYKFQQESAVW